MAALVDDLESRLSEHKLTNYLRPDGKSWAKERVRPIYELSQRGIPCDTTVGCIGVSIHVIREIIRFGKVTPEMISVDSSANFFAFVPRAQGLRNCDIFTEDTLRDLQRIEDRDRKTCRQKQRTKILAEVHAALAWLDPQKDKEKVAKLLLQILKPSTRATAAKTKNRVAIEKLSSYADLNDRLWPIIETAKEFQGCTLGFTASALVNKRLIVEPGKLPKLLEPIELENFSGFFTTGEPETLFFRNLRNF